MTLSTDRLTVVHLGEPEACDPTLVGGKAAVLSRLLADGYPVPPGFVFPWPTLAPLLSGDAGEAGAAVRDQLVEALASLGDVSVAVRSSGVAEDLTDASYAGQYETVLGVRGPHEVMDAVRRCVESADAERVRVYGERKADGASAPMAVLVQLLVHADAAGVAFSANPVTGDAEVVVSAVRGLGERLVSGQTTPDEWIVRGSETECRAAPEGAIGEDDVRRVADLAKRLEATLGGPQDVEWALAGNELFLLQSRPITALPRRPEFDIPTEGYWMKDDSHYPEPITPFGASVYVPALTQGLRPLIEQFGLLVDGSDQRSLGGEVYTRMIPMGGKDRNPPPWWVLWIASRVTPSIRHRAGAAKEALRTDLPRRLIDRWNEGWREEFRTEGFSLRRRDLRALDDGELLDHLDTVLALMNRGQQVHFLLWGAYTFTLYELAKACKELLGWGPAETLALVSGISKASSEPGRALDMVAATIGASLVVREVIFTGGSDVLHRLGEVAPDAAAAVHAYLDEHGHRTLSYDPGGPTLAERPEILAGFLRDRLSGRSSPGDVERSREEAVERARTLLAERALDADRFERALAAATHAYPSREDNVIWTDNVPGGLLRYAAMEIGRRLAERGVIGNAEDAVFLEDAELRAGLKGDRHDLGVLVTQRRAERAWVVAHPGPTSYGIEPGPPPDLRGLPPALRLIMETLMWMMELMSPPPVAEAADDGIRGLPGSSGSYTGPVRVIRDASEFGRLRPGDVLVCAITSPAWSVLFSQAGAVVTDGGGVLSHAAVIAREYGIPAVMGTVDATRRLSDGEVVLVDGTGGVVRSARTEV